MVVGWRFGEVFGVRASWMCICVRLLTDNVYLCPAEFDGFGLAGFPVNV